jgi:hypothetical protein
MLVCSKEGKKYAIDIHIFAHNLNHATISIFNSLSQNGVYAPLAGVRRGATPTTSILDTLYMVNYFNPVHFRCLAPMPMVFLYPKAATRSKDPRAKEDKMVMCLTRTLHAKSSVYLSDIGWAHSNR